MKTHLGPPSRDFDGAEFALVTALAFGLSIVGSLAAAISYSNRELVIGDVELIGILAYQLIMGPVIATILRSRGWKWTDFAVHASRGSTILGLLLALGVLAAWVVFEAVMGKVPNRPEGSLPAVLAVSIVNPVFEEMLVLAYVIQAMRRRFGLTTAVNVSLAIRLLYHLYQGPLVVIPIALFGLVMTLVYVRMGRLWPVIVAHAIVDFVGLSAWAPS